KKLWNQVPLYIAAVWLPQKQRLIKITTPELPEAFLSGDKSNVIIYNSLQYEPQYAYKSPIDYFNVNLVTEKKDLVLKKHFWMLTHTLAAPNKNEILYFKDNDWWIIDLQTNNRINLTQSISVNLSNDGNESNGWIQPYGIAGWTDGGDTVLLYDHFDIWKVKTTGEECVRLTKGREKGVRYRIVEFDENPLPSQNWDGWKGRLWDLNNGIMVKGFHSQGTTYLYSLKEEEGLKQLLKKDSELDQFLVRDNGVFYREQRY